MKPWEKIATGACLLIAIGAGIRLGAYLSDRAESQRVNAELREVYTTAAETTGNIVRSEQGEEPSGTERIEESALMNIDLADGEPAGLDLDDKTKISHTTAASHVVPETLPVLRNGREEYAEIAALQEASEYIVGWLTVPDQVDEAVAQKDHDFFLDHDVYGNPNSNGAIFLDSLCSLETRPYTILLYGHNMRSGEKFGRLRRYEEHEYYEGHRVITFTSLRDSGEYEIFAAGAVSVNRSAANYVNFYNLTSSSTALRRHEINTLMDCSVIESGIIPQADEQILALVTCEGDADERWVVCARRVE